MFFKPISSLLAVLLLTLLASPASHAQILPQDQSKAIILAYHRIGEDAYPETNLRLDQFALHVEEIERGGFTVLPLPQILNALAEARPLPDKTLAITFEGAYRSAYKNAIPHLINKEIPFTVIYASDTADQKIADYMSWEDLKTLSKSPLVSITTLPSTYDYVVYDGEHAILKSLNKARQKYREAFNKEAEILSYPFGVYTPEFEKLAAQQGYKAALTLDSGASHSGSNLLTLPRFTITEDFGDLDRFRMVTRSLPLPTSDFLPNSTLLRSAAPFAAGFTLPANLKDTPDCFLSGQKKPTLEKLGQRIELRASEGEALSDRMRLNCMMMGKTDEDGHIRWRWLGKLFHLSPAPQSELSPEPDAPQ